MRVICLLVAVAIAFAGCAEGTDNSEEPEEVHDHGDHDHNGTVAINNTAPVAKLTADVLNGTAPLLVNLTLDGSDPDGDNLTWSLDHNGTQVSNGTTLPASHQLNLTAGNHSVQLTISDGNATATANLTIVVEVAAPAEDPNAPVDMGAFTYDPATGHCHYKTYDTYGAVYNFDFWVFAETNDTPGLQVANNFLVAAAEDQGFRMDEWDICEDGDQMVF